MFAFLVSQARTANIAAHEEKAFIQYMRDTNNVFTGDEYQFRLGIFLANKRQVQEFNQQGKSFRVGLNKFSHYTAEEYKALLGAKQLSALKPAKKSTVKAADSCDWRTKNVVNPIKDQAQCGSCWAFSAITALESQWAIQGNELLSLSEQNLVDCVSYCYGCNGGWPSSAYEYVKLQQGGQFNLESDYAYTGVDGSCKFSQYKAYARVKDYVSVEAYSEDDLAAKVSSLGVASICIDASNWSFQLYTSGIYDESRCSGYSLDHAVACVGYGTENSTDYWIVRNSWGTSWGEQGYIRMIRNKNNQCGVASTAIVPTCV